MFRPPLPDDGCRQIAVICDPRTASISDALGTIYAPYERMRKLLAIIVFGMAATASAQPNTYYPQNRQPQTEERYAPQNKLGEVRLEGYRGRAYIALPQTGRDTDYLELRAGRARVQLDNVEVRFADGRVINTGDRGIVEPFQGRVIDLPRHSAAVTAIVPTYRTLNRRGVARLEVYAVPEHDRWRAERDSRDYRWRRRY